jgi:hypothetical protein
VTDVEQIWEAEENKAVLIYLLSAELVVETAVNSVA